LLFNTFGCLLFIVPLWILKNDVTAFFASMSNDVGQQIAIFHTLFNIVTTLILLPIAQYVVKLACLIVPDKKGSEENKYKFQFIDTRMLSTPPIAASNIKKEIIRMSALAKENINLAMDMLLDNGDHTEIIEENEDVINHLNKNIVAFLTKLKGKELNEQDDKKIGSYYHVVSDIERVGDYAENIMEYAMRLREAGQVLSIEAKNELKELTDIINTLYDHAFTAFDDRNLSLLPKVEEVEEIIDSFSKELEDRHIDRVKQGACQAQTGSVFLQTISNMERVGDHITNVAFSIRKYRAEKSV
jgi:phosphate:Na+ symporter